jgi:PAS domain S-box-containing protein
MFGYTLRDIPTGRQWFKKAYPDKNYRHQVIEAWITDLERYKLGKSRPRSYMVTCKDGLKKMIHFRPVTMTGGEQFIICEDITELEHAENELRRKEEGLRVITDNIPGLVSYIDAEGCYRFVNNQYEKWFGVSRNHIIGKHCRAVLGDNTFKKLETYVEEALSGNHVQYEETLPYQSGGTRWVHADYVPDIDEDGNVKGFFALVTDITERKQAEEALRVSEERYRELADSITDVFFAMDENLHYVYWNKASEELTGISAKDALGKSLVDIFQDTPQTRRAETVYREVLRTRHPQTFINEHQLGGKDFFFEISAYPSGRGLSIVAKDITEQRKAEQEKARLQAMLQRAQKMEALGRLITMVAHEILNPVNIISMRLQLMNKAEEVPESIRKAVTICESQLDRIHEITKNLGEFSRIPKNQGAMSDLNTIIGHVVALYEPKFKADNITPDIRFHPGLPQIPLDKERIEQVILNIIANAGAAMEGRESKILRIETRPTDSNGGVQVVISDNGTGIESSDAERIFEPYFTTKNNPQDTGMGLFISHTIIQDHGGRIWAENNEWGGASFFIEFPEVNDITS